MRASILVLSLLCVPLASQDQDKRVAEKVQVGQTAPVFRLNDHLGKAVQVGGETDLWTVLAFYPKAATPG